MRNDAVSVAEALDGPHQALVLSPVTTNRGKALHWLKRGGGALDGVIAKRSDETYRAGERAMVKVKQRRTADCVVAGYREHKSGPDAVGSLLLGLYDDEGTLSSVGVIGALPMATRRALVHELAPLVERAHETGCVVTKGLGPRYLHSTGQLHKGGPDTGRFIQVVDETGDELPIPGRDFGFGRLIRSQAAGDFAALEERGRRVIRLRLEDL